MIRTDTISKRRSRWRRGLRRLATRRVLLVCAGLAALLATLILGYGALRWFTWPDVAALRTANPTSTAFIELHQRRTGSSVSLDWVPWDRIDAGLKYAVVVAEDAEFLDHDGFSAYEIRAAIRKALQEGRAPRGASTITQQLAKNLWLNPSYNPLRKLEEAILTRQLERTLSKKRILEIYLNVVEFGPGIYGVGIAAPHYFDRSARRLSQRRCAMLAASLPRPATWHPGVERPGYDRYVETIRDRMRRFEGLKERIKAL